MSEQQPVQDFVAAQRTGGQHQGDGCFTLNPAEALAKLALFQLPQPSYWILKCLQAAVAQTLKGPVRFDFESTQIRVSFEISEGWTAEQVYRAVLNPEISSGQDALSHLVVALRGLAAQANWGYGLSLPNGGGRLSWCQGELSVGPSDTLPLLHLEAKAPTPSLNSQPSHIKELKYLLATRGAVSPRLVKVGKKPISLMANLVDQALPVRSIYETYLLNIHTVQAPWPSFPLPGNLAQGVEALLHPPGQTKPKSPSVQEAAMLSFLWCKPKGGVAIRLAWVRDGVIVWERNVSFRGPGVTLQIYLSAEGHQSDLTGFQLVESDRLCLQTHWALEESLAELQRQSEALAINPVPSLSLTPWDRFCISMQEQPDWTRKPSSGEKRLALAKLFSGFFVPVGLLLLNDQLKIRGYRRQTETALRTLRDLWPRIEKEFG